MKGVSGRWFGVSKGASCDKIYQVQIDGMYTVLYLISSGA